jgi:protein-S-isoprenylcysteine O-methyltransferase Ste14
MKESTLREILGYLMGGLLALAVFPSAFYGLSLVLDPILGFALFSNIVARIATAAALASIGVPFAISSLVFQNRIGKGGPLQAMNIGISPKTRHLVVIGPYKYTRNPMLFGAICLYLAFAVLLDSPGALVAVVLFSALMLTFVKLTEEKRLLEDFGEEYEKYRARVSMFIPWLPRDRLGPSPGSAR